ncbi:MAG: hypothetical protein GY866_10930, partial [Proteobacteria bacterium]|nr:hypothetical protein [Pseudomonadota bacterium]
MIQAVLPLATLYLMKLVIDTVADGLKGAGEPADFEPIAVLIGLTASTALIGHFC